jgi:hypothetical protein
MPRSSDAIPLPNLLPARPGAVGNRKTLNDSKSLRKRRRRFTEVKEGIALEFTPADAASGIPSSLEPLVETAGGSEWLDLKVATNIASMLASS